MTRTSMIVLVALLLLTFLANAAPIAVSQSGRITVTLTDEPCALDAITNLPARLIWEENRRSIEGCYTVAKPLIIAYFADRTVILMFANAFTRVQAI